MKLLAVMKIECFEKMLEVGSACHVLPAISYGFDEVLGVPEA